MVSHTPTNLSVTASFHKLRALSSLISSSLDDLEKTCAQLDTPWPDLDKAAYTSDCTLDANFEALRSNNVDVSKAVETVVASAFQLIASVREPKSLIIQSSATFHYSTCVRIAAELHIADILRDAGEGGMHIDKIAGMVNVDAPKLARILRVLATHHVFMEVSPDVFANNRISSVLEKGQKIDDLIKTPSIKFDKPESATSALICFFTDVLFKSSSVLFETLTDARTAFSGSPARCALAKSAELNPFLNETATSQAPRISGNEFQEFSVFDLIAREVSPSCPLNFPSERLRSFGVAMRAITDFFPTEEVIEGFEFGMLQPSDIVFDVGGGVGFTAELLARKHTNLRIVVQERPEVCDDGLNMWKKNFPEALSDGRVVFQAHDFFTPQKAPLTSGTPIYLVKHCLLNWSDEYAIRILHHLSDAVNVIAKSDPNAREKARLLVLEAVIPYAARDTHTVDEGKHEIGEPSSEAVAKPEAPLLPNWGVASAMTYYMDMKMLTVLNGQHRTLAHFRSLFRMAGWEITKVTRSKRAAQFFAMLEAKVI